MMGSNQTAAPRVIILMGVAGSGKTVVGSRLATQLGGPFFDADQFHPPENIAKMAAGVPLSDTDRKPWFEAMRRQVVEAAPPGTTWVLACSALKKAYRNFLRRPNETDVRFIFLDGDYNLIFARMAERKDHFMREGMLRSQFETLERPDAQEAMTVGVDQSRDAIVAEIIRRL
jgi:gluconokinase